MNVPKLVTGFSILQSAYDSRRLAPFDERNLFYYMPEFAKRLINPLTHDFPWKAKVVYYIWNKKYQYPLEVKKTLRNTYYFIKRINQWSTPDDLVNTAWIIREIIRRGDLQMLKAALWFDFEAVKAVCVQHDQKGNTLLHSVPPSMLANFAQAFEVHAVEFFSIQNAKGDTLAHHLLATGDADTIESICKIPNMVHALSRLRNTTEKSPFDHAIYNKNLNVWMLAVIARGAPEELPSFLANGEFRTPIHWAAGGSDIDLQRRLISAAIDFWSERPDAQSDVIYTKFDVLWELRKSNPEYPPYKDTSSFATTLNLLEGLSAREIMQLLLTEDPNGIRLAPCSCKTLWAARTCKTEMIRKLILVAKDVSPQKPEIEDYFDNIITQRQTVKLKFKSAIKKASIIGKGVNKGAYPLEDSFWMEPFDIYYSPIYLRTKKERNPYLVSWQNGRAQRNGEIYTTQNESTRRLGKGSAIFVISSEGEWFLGSHSAKKFHHSSFLAGGTVFGAGEICINTKGELDWLSNESVHYQLTPEKMLPSLTILQNQGVDLSKVTLYILRGPGDQVSYCAQEFLESNGSCSPNVD